MSTDGYDRVAMAAQSRVALQTAQSKDSEILKCIQEGNAGKLRELLRSVRFELNNIDRFALYYFATTCDSNHVEVLRVICGSLISIEEEQDSLGFWRNQFNMTRKSLDEIVKLLNEFRTKAAGNTERIKAFDIEIAYYTRKYETSQAPLWTSLRYAKSDIVNGVKSFASGFDRKAPPTQPDASTAENAAPPVGGRCRSRKKKSCRKRKNTYKHRKRRK